MWFSKRKEKIAMIVSTYILWYVTYMNAGSETIANGKYSQYYKFKKMAASSSPSPLAENGAWYYCLRLFYDFTFISLVDFSD